MVCRLLINMDQESMMDSSIDYGGFMHLVEGLGEI